MMAILRETIYPYNLSPRILKPFVYNFLLLFLEPQYPSYDKETKPVCNTPV